MLYTPRQTIFFFASKSNTKYDFSCPLKQAGICNSNKSLLQSLKSAKFCLLCTGVFQHVF